MSLQIFQGVGRNKKGDKVRTAKEIFRMPLHAYFALLMFMFRHEVIRISALHQDARGGPLLSKNLVDSITKRGKRRCLVQLGPEFLVHGIHRVLQVGKVSSVMERVA